MTRFLPLFVLILILAAPCAALESSVIDEIDEQLALSFEQLVEIRRDLHQHAESAGNEERTAGIVADRLEALGLEVRRGVGGHGVVALLQGSKPGPVIAYRADMDAMATQAADPEEFRSGNPAVNHVCGHDIHTTVGLAIAEVLAEQSAELAGTVMFIFQPAEEVATGAKAMIDDGALDGPIPDMYLALHCAPVPVGELLLLEGMALPGFELLEVRCSGDGDLESAAGAVARACMSITNTPPPMSTSIQDMVTPAGRPYHVGNAISTDADPETGDFVVTGFIKASDEESYAEARTKLSAALGAIDVEGVSIDLEFLGTGLPAMVNDIELGKRTTQLAREVLGESNVQSMPGSVPFFGEDFSYFQQQAPGVLYFLGVANPAKGINGMPHAPNFRADEDAILVGARAMTAVILGLGAE